MKISRHLFQIRALIPPRASSACTNRVKVLQCPRASSGPRALLGVGLLGQTQGVLGHNWFYNFFGLENLTSSVVYTFQNGHCQIESFLEKICKNDSVCEVFLILRD